jgi:hypothetical protein
MVKNIALLDTCGAKYCAFGYTWWKICLFDKCGAKFAPLINVVQNIAP